jgi:hypothetical protein
MLSHADGEGGGKSGIRFPYVCCHAEPSMQKTDPPVNAPIEWSQSVNGGSASHIQTLLSNRKHQRISSQNLLAEQ